MPILAMAAPQVDTTIHVSSYLWRLLPYSDLTPPFKSGFPLEWTRSRRSPTEYPRHQLPRSGPQPVCFSIHRLCRWALYWCYFHSFHHLGSAETTPPHACNLYGYKQLHIPNVSENVFWLYISFYSVPQCGGPVLCTFGLYVADFEANPPPGCSPEVATTAASIICS